MITFDVNAEVFNPNSIKLACSKAELLLTNQVMKDTRPYVPALTNSLNQRTIQQGNTIVYPAPYARYLYEGKVMVDAQTGRGAFYIEDVGFRFHKGATLVPTNRDLVFTKEVNAKAQSHWFEASKRDNLQKWLRIAAKAVANLGK